MDEEALQKEVKHWRGLFEAASAAADTWRSLAQAREELLISMMQDEDDARGTMDRIGRN